MLWTTNPKNSMLGIGGVDSEEVYVINVVDAAIKYTNSTCAVQVEIVPPVEVNTDASSLVLIGWLEDTVITVRSQEFGRQKLRIIGKASNEAIARSPSWWQNLGVAISVFFDEAVLQITDQTKTVRWWLNLPVFEDDGVIQQVLNLGNEMFSLTESGYQVRTNVGQSLAECTYLIRCVFILANLIVEYIYIYICMRVHERIYCRVSLIHDGMHATIQSMYGALM
jgi:hypothetical protein